ncbi:MAG: glutamine-hydrolyzing GMP synthase [Spirochaetales bacterium]|nr:glutamine-hydrolyzing GMP synthase [Spirochaetales bacterium]
MDKILIFDFGGQTCQLISRRVREIGVYTEVVPGDSMLSELSLEGVKGVIMSGSPESVNSLAGLKVDPALYDAHFPVLGICYGFQRMTHDTGGEVKSLDKREFGRAPVTFRKECRLFQNIPDGFTSWMSHGDSISSLGAGFSLVGESLHHIAAGVQEEKQLYGIQFHPEVSHCDYGNEILKNFVIEVCGARPEWNMERYLQQVMADIQATVKERPVLLLISGGVDSTVVGGLLLKALPSDQVYLMYIDTGLMRKNETEEVEGYLQSLGAKHLKIIDASADFLTALLEVADPEEKRRIIGDMFISVQEREVAKLKLTNSFLAQGTLYTDMIESGKGVGKKAHVIKSHHNVRSPLVESKRDAGLVIEPLQYLYKDEVRELGRNIGLPETMVGRHPFPGPGLAVRILGDVTVEKCDILREADYIFVNELKNRGLYDKIWQAFCVLLPVRSVGVTGDAREYGYVLALRAITSRDGMTADVYPFETRDLLEISSLITNSVRQIGRVVYDISSKPPATIEWE